MPAGGFGFGLVSNFGGTILWSVVPSRRSQVRPSKPKQYSSIPKPENRDLLLRFLFEKLRNSHTCIICHFFKQIIRFLWSGFWLADKKESYLLRVIKNAKSRKLSYICLLRCSILFLLSYFLMLLHTLPLS